MTIGERIKGRREELGMSQEELAKKTGYANRASIAMIENGERDLRQHRILAFAKALEMTPGKLLGWEDSDRLRDMFAKLDYVDQARALGYIEALLTAEKYSVKKTS